MITGCTLDRFCVVGESESEDEGTNKGMFFLEMARYHFFKSDTDIINFDISLYRYESDIVCVCFF